MDDNLENGSSSDLDNEVEEKFLADGFDSEVEKKFVVDSNEALHFKLLRETKDLESEQNSFQPEMSHQVFGKTEKVFGYNDLKIELFYTAGWLRTYINMAYKEKISPSVIGLPADDVMKTLSTFLEHDYLENLDSFVSTLKDEVSFKPAGILIDSLSLSEENETSRKYEIYHVHLSNTDSKYFNDYYRRLQHFVIWYIDGASYVDFDDERWNYFIMYEKYLNENQDWCYGVVAFSTVYEYYAYPSHTRPRISQLLVLPPFQRRGLAVYLINSIYKHYLKNDSVIDITVEDPTENCQAVRDFLDMCRCEKLDCFAEDKLKSGFTVEMETELRTKFKIHKKQARRIYEILLLRAIDKSDENEYKKYRISVKKRLNAPFQKMGSMMRRMNYTFKPNEVEQAAVFQKPEIRYESLTRLYNELEDQYERVIERFENCVTKPVF